jgi:hypothetical protein
VLPATPPILDPASSPSVAPIGTSNDSSARTSAPPTPRLTVPGTSTVPTPPSPAPTPSAPTREHPAPVPLVPARSPVRTREKHAQATRASTRSSASRPPDKYGDWIHYSVAPPVHFAPCICLTLLLLPASMLLRLLLILIH